MNRSAVGYGLAALTLVMLALTFASFFAPIEYTTFGLVVRTPDGANARITSIYPGSDAARNGLRAGDVIDLKQLTLSQRFRLEGGSSPVGTTIRVPIVRSGETRFVVLRAEQQAKPRYSMLLLTTLVSGTLSLLTIALIVFRQPSLATAMLVLYGAGVPQSLPFATLFTFIPDPFFGVVAVVIQMIVAQLPIWSLLPFIARFPMVPDTAQARVTARFADSNTVSSLRLVITPPAGPSLACQWSLPL